MKRNKHITVGLSEEELNDLKKKADDVGLSVNGYVRHILLYKHGEQR